jgi:hypothetical protein
MRKKTPIREIYLAGQLAGMAAQLDIDELQKYLDSNPPDFHYVRWCKAAIAFARAVTETRA